MSRVPERMPRHPLWRAVPDRFPGRENNEVANQLCWNSPGARRALRLSHACARVNTAAIDVPR